MIEKSLYNSLIEAKKITVKSMKRDREIVKIINRVIHTKKLSLKDNDRLQYLMKLQTGVL